MTARMRDSRKKKKRAEFVWICRGKDKERDNFKESIFSWRASACRAQTDSRVEKETGKIKQTWKNREEREWILLEGHEETVRRNRDGESRKLTG